MKSFKQFLNEKLIFGRNSRPHFIPKNKKELIEIMQDHETLPYIDTSLITDMSGLFKGWKNIKFLEGINDWDTSNVTDMSSMFEDCDVDICTLRWNTSKVKNMSRMFYNCSAAGIGGLNNWDVSKVKDMSYMFAYSGFDRDISNWDVGNVENMNYMFYNAKQFNQPLNTWKFKKLRTAKGMFEDSKCFNQPLDKWKMSKVEDIRNMFRDSKFKQDLSKWKVSDNAKVMTRQERMHTFNYADDKLAPIKYAELIRPSYAEIWE